MQKHPSHLEVFTWQFESTSKTHYTFECYFFLRVFQDKYATVTDFTLNCGVGVFQILNWPGLCKPNIVRISTGEVLWRRRPGHLKLISPLTFSFSCFYLKFFTWNSKRHKSLQQLIPCLMFFICTIYKHVCFTTLGIETF